jgi:DNA-directed RNA polymerase specialized sigma subunit
MNKEELSSLIKIKAEIEQIKCELSKAEPEYGIDAVTGSSPNFPYVKHSIIIEGYDIKTYNAKLKRIQNRLNRKMIELIDEKDKLTEYIYELKDSDLRQILIYRYVDGLIWEKIGAKMNYSFETIRKKHDKFLKSIPTNTSLSVVH